MIKKINIELFIKTFLRIRPEALISLKTLYFSCLSENKMIIYQQMNSWSLFPNLCLFIYLFMYFISLFSLGWYIISHELERRYLLKWKIKLNTYCILILIVDCYYLFIDIEKNYAKKYVKDKNIILVKYMNILWIE